MGDIEYFKAWANKKKWKDSLNSRVQKIRSPYYLFTLQFVWKGNNRDIIDKISLLLDEERGEKDFDGKVISIDTKEAVIKSGGTSYIVNDRGDLATLRKIGAKKGDTITFVYVKEAAKAIVVQGMVVSAKVIPPDKPHKT